MQSAVYLVFFQIKTQFEITGRNYCFAGSVTEIVPRLPNAKRATTFEDRLRKIRGTRLFVVCTSVSLRLRARVHVTYSFEYQKFDVCQKRKLLLFLVFASEHEILRKIGRVIESDKSLLYLV